VAELKDGEIRSFTLDPQEYGLELVAPEALKGRDPEYNAAALRAVLNGTRSAYRDIVLLNAAAALLVGGAAADVLSGLQKAAEALDSGAARRVLGQLVSVTGATP
jgi:anthranilate phosphoribosyltransferase